MADPNLMLLAANLSSLSYEVELAKLTSGAEALGCQFLGFITNGRGGADQGDAQALVVDDGTRQIIVRRGTQVAENFNLSELWSDVDLSHAKLWNGTQAACGWWRTASAVMPGVMQLLKPGRPTLITGHSKGGAEATINRCWFPKDYDVKVITFGAPASVDHAFFAEAYGDITAPGLDRVTRDADFAPDWGPWDQPVGSFVWFRKGVLTMTNRRGWPNMSIADHSDAGYASDCGRMVNQAVAA